MKSLKSLKFILIISLIMLFSSTGFAQDMTQNETTQEMEVAAKNEVQKWEEELSLTAKQMALMKKKIVEFIIKRQKVMNENISEEKKLESLKNLKILETREIRDILTKPQYDRYLMLMEQEAQTMNNRK